MCHVYIIFHVYTFINNKRLVLSRNSVECGCPLYMCGCPLYLCVVTCKCARVCDVTRRFIS